MKDKLDFCPKCGGEMVEKEVTLHFNIPDKPEKHSTSQDAYPVKGSLERNESSESLSKENIDWENRVGVPKCPDCRKGSNVRLYTKEWMMIGNEEVCPWICDECNIIWCRDEDIINAKKLESEKEKDKHKSDVSLDVSNGHTTHNLADKEGIAKTPSSSEISGLKRWTGFDVSWKLHWLEKVLSSAEICYGDKSKQFKDAKKEYWKFYNEIFFEADDVEKVLDEIIKRTESGEYSSIELGCGKCYNLQHITVPYNCSCVCHKVNLLKFVYSKILGEK